MGTADIPPQARGSRVPQSITSPRMSSRRRSATAPQNEDLGVILSGMNASTERAMSSLYNLEVATINANGQNPTHHSARYKEIRIRLKDQWEAIINLLKGCYSFGTDVELLKTQMKTMSREDLEELLQEMAASCKGYVETADGLVNGHDSIIAVYSTHEHEFRAELKQPKVVVDPRRLHKNPYENTARAERAPGRSASKIHTTRASPPQPESRRENVHNPVADFVADNIKTLYPDGEEAIKDFLTSTQNIHQNLVALSKFLQLQTTICEQCLAGLMNPTKALKLETIRMLATQWMAYQAEIMQSISSIAKVSDAIMVEAAVLPPSATREYGRALEYGNGGEERQRSSHGRGSRNTAPRAPPATDPAPYNPYDPRGYLPNVTINFGFRGSQWPSNRYS